MKTKFRKSMQVVLTLLFGASLLGAAAPEERSTHSFLQEDEPFSRTFDVGQSGSSWGRCT